MFNSRDMFNFALYSHTDRQNVHRLHKTLVLQPPSMAHYSGPFNIVSSVVLSVKSFYFLSTKTMKTMFP